MANIFITDKCQRKCDFCFAKTGPWSEDYLPRLITETEVKEFVGLPSHENNTVLGIIGGEPLLHPNLVDLVHIFQQQGVTAKIFTSGTVAPEFVLDALGSIESLFFVVNAHPRERYSEKEWQNLEAFFQRFHEKINLGCTLLNQDTGYLLEYISKYRLRPFIRLGVALPVIGGDNAHIPSGLYEETAKNILQLAENCARKGISLGFDCGFVACMFTIEEIGILLRAGVDLSFSCSPAVDVGPDLESWYCFPLSKFSRIPVREMDNLFQLKEKFGKLDKMIRKFCSPGIFDRCSNCRLRRNNQCSGGCLAMIINQHTEKTGMSAEDIISVIEERLLNA
ncbi:MAG: radical SAM protein [Pseudomonadota bacterium]